jgi:hypothetical protein
MVKLLKAIIAGRPIEASCLPKVSKKASEMPRPMSLTLARTVISNQENFSKDVVDKATNLLMEEWFAEHDRTME